MKARIYPKFIDNRISGPHFPRVNPTQISTACFRDAPRTLLKKYLVPLLSMLLLACVAGVVVAAPVNLALNKTAVASSTQSSTYPAAAAFDGNTATRWSSAFSDPQWIYVDLGASYTVNRVKLTWEAAYATAFKIQASNDAATWTDIYSTTTGSGGIQDLTVTQTTARYIRMYGTARGTAYGYSLWEMEVYEPSTVNLALNKPAVASSIQSSTYPAAAAFDGSAATRWSSAFSDPQWIYVDLGASFAVNRVKLTWEAAYATAFKIQASNDAATWTDIYSTTTGSGGIQDLTVTQTTARYIRMYGTVRGTAYGYSLWEMEVYAPATATTVTITNPGDQSTNINTPVNLQINATDSAGNALTYSATGLPTGLSINSTTGLISGTPTQAGSSNVTVTASSSGGSANVTFTWTILSGGGGGGSTVNLALNKPAVASSIQSSTYPAAAAFDGNTSTRWSSAFSDPQWIYVDLGASYSVNRVKLTWEAAYAKAFTIQASTDAGTWTDIYSTTTGSGGIQDLSVTQTTARYIRMYGTVRGTIYGYSLWEMEVYGPGTATTVTITNPGAQSTNINTPVSLQINATDSGGNALTYSATGLPTGLSINSTTGLISGTPTQAGSYNVTVTASSSGGSANMTFTWTILSGGGGSTVNLALNKPATASSIQSSSYPAAAAFDGNTTTRWSSAFSDPQWIYADLGASNTVNRVKLTWEAAYAKAFKIQASTDAATWTDIYSTTTGSGGIQDLAVTQTTARYIRMYGTVRGTIYGYSLWEMEVYGPGTSTGTTVSITNPGAQSTDVSGIVNLQVQAQDSASNPLSYSATGLPPGLTINPSTGKITGSATNQAGIYQATVVASSKGGTNNASFTWTVTIPASPAVDILMSRYDTSGAAANLAETKLNVSNVNGQQFGRLFSLPVYGKIYAQPLYVSNVTIPNQGTHNVLYVATMEDMLYAFDAQSGALLWLRNDLVPSGATPFPVADAAYTNSLNIAGDVGIESTPVIDRPTNTLYFVQRTKENGRSVFRLRAVDIITGLDKLVSGGVTISASYSIGGGTVTFDPSIQNQRPGLTIARGQVIIGFGSHEDFNHYHGWIMAYDMNTLQQTGTLVVSPSSYGGAVWMSGRAPVVDSNGYAYLFTGNSFNSPGWNPGANDFDRGESALKLDPLQSMNVIDWFTPSNWAALDTADLDLTSSGPIQIPGTSFLLGGGKDGNLFLLAKDNLAGGPLQTLTFLGENRNGPAMWLRTAAKGGSRIYMSVAGDLVRSFPFDGTSLQAQYAQANDTAFGYPGAYLSVSANGETAGSGIVWAYGANLIASQDASHQVAAGEMRAYDADTLHLLWKSTTNFARDDLGLYGKFTIPVVANGQVYVATQSNQVVVYGQLPSSADFTVTALPSYAPTLAGTATFSLNANPINGFGGTVTWSISGPSGVSATFCSTNTNPCTGNPSNTGNLLWVNVAAQQAPLGQSLLTVTATSGQLPPHTQQVVLNVTNTQNVALPWAIYSVDSQDSSGLAINAIDQQNGTFWITKITGTSPPGQPHEIVIDLGQDNIPLKALSILPRQDGCSTGSPRQFQVYIAPTLSSSWSSVDVIGDSFDYSNMNWGCNLVQPRQQQFMFWPNTSARLVKFRTLTEVNDGKPTSAAEIKLFQ